MRLKLAAIALLILSTASLAPAQRQQYVISTFAGGVPPPIPLTPAQGLDMSIGNSVVAADEAGNVYFASFNCVFRLDRNGLVIRVAGNSRRGYSGDGGPAPDAQLADPAAIAVDGTGNLFIADSSNHRIRKVSPDGIITTVACNGVPGFSIDGGPATAAHLYYPHGLAVDRAGNLFIVDSPASPINYSGRVPGHRVRRVSLDGTITTVAGNGVPGFSGDGGPATSAQLSYPQSIAVDGSGNLFVGASSFGSPRIRKVSADGIIATVVNSETSNPDCAASLISRWNQPGFCWPGTVAVDRTGNLYFAEFGEVLDEASTYHAIRKLSVEGIITTVAGNRPEGYSGDGGVAVDAQIAWSNSLAVGGAGDLFLADGPRLRKISTGGIITTVAGNGKYRPDPIDGGPAADTYLNRPTGVAVDNAGNVFIMSEGNRFLKEETAIRRVSPGGIITTVVSGLPCAYPDYWLATDELPCIGTSMAADGAGNLFFVESFRVRKVSLDGAVTSMAGNGEQGYYGDGGLAVNARLSSDLYIAVDGMGSLFIADGWNRRVRKVSPDGVITTVAGNGIGGWSGDGGLATKAELYPGWVAVDTAGNLFISDIGRIRKVSPNGIINTIAGDGRLVYSGDGGPATSATGVFGPLATDASGNLFIALRNDSNGCCYVRRISPDGVITIVAGNGTFGYTGDGGPATDAQLGFSGFRSSSVAADGWGNVYLADAFNNAIRVLRPVAAQ